MSKKKRRKETSYRATLFLIKFTQLFIKNNLKKKIKILVQMM